MMQRGVILSLALFFAALPATSNYKLNSYGFGSGGTAGSSTTTYSLEGTAGQLSGQSGSTANNRANPGFIQTEQANVPKLASIDNNGGQYYNKLHFVIDNQNNPTDATFLIAVTSTTDSHCTSICYVQTDGTLSTTLSTADYQSYSAWGGSSGSVMIGLLPSTTYNVKLRATQGRFTESAYGPSTSQATAAPSLTFSLSPSSVSLGTITPGDGNVYSAASTINTSLSTNGTSGGDVYITGKNGGLKSSSTGYQINAVSSDLSGLNEGFGAQNSSVTQTSGGPYSVVSPYNTSGTIVGIVNGTTRSLYTSTAPVTSGAGALLLKAKAAKTDTAATDYQEVLTFVAAANF